MKDIILIHSADELLSISNMEGYYKLECDIDLAGKDFKPIGSENNPFAGTFDGGKHVIKNVSIKANSSNILGFFGAFEGYAFDLTIENLQIKGETKNDAIVGAIVGVHYGSLANVNVISGEINITATGKNSILVLGGIAGETHDEIRNCLSGVDVMVVTTGAKVISGGMAGIAGYGFLETLKATGRYAYIGSEKLIDAACIVAYAENVITRANKFESPMNTINGKVYTECFIKDKEVVHDGNIWRDNRNDDSFLPEGELALRKEAAEHMRRMATCEWTPTVDMEFECSCEKKPHTLTYKAGEKQYGLPYAHSARSFEEFEDSFEEDGSLKPYIKTSGFNGFDLYMGVDSASAIYWALARISDKVNFSREIDMSSYAKKGFKILGDISIKDGERTEETVMSDDNTWRSYEEGLAMTHVGDVLLYHNGPGTGHAKMVVSTPVIFRNEDGDILDAYSYLNIIGQGEMFLTTNHDPSPSKTWAVDRKFYLVRCQTERYLPVTFDGYKKGKKAAENISYEAAKGANCVTDGKVKSNYRIISTQAVIADKKTGEVVFDKKLYTATNAFVYTEDGEKPRKTVKSVDLGDYAPYFAGARIPKGRYIYTLDVTLSTGNTHRVAEKEFSL